LAFAEENKFTKGYTIPLVQLDTLKTILVFSHKHNSLNKEKLLENPAQSKMSLSKFTVDDFIKDPFLKQFYMHDMNSLLVSYEPGRPEHKPQLLEQIKTAEINREKRMTEYNQMLSTQNNQKINASNDEIVNEMRNSYEKKIDDKNYIINELIKKIKLLNEEISTLKSKL